MRFKLGDKVTNYFRIDIKKNKEFLFLYKRTRILCKQSVAFSPWECGVAMRIAINLPLIIYNIEKHEKYQELEN